MPGACLGGLIGIATHLLLTAAVVGLVLAVGARYLQHRGDRAARRFRPLPNRPLLPEAPAAELVPMLRNAKGRVMEMVHYRVRQDQVAAFMAMMREVRQVRGRSGAQFWQVYEDVAHPEGWIEVWSMESWTDHLRESTRRSDSDRLILARAAVFQHDAERPSRYLAVDPHEHRQDTVPPHRSHRTHLPVARPVDGLNNA